MPYENEMANKASHFDIVRNPDVTDFLSGCDFLKPPSDEEAAAIAALFAAPPATAGVGLPDRVIALDGSFYESSISERLPSTKVGYVKVGAILIELSEFAALREGRFVDPFRVAELRNQNDALPFVLPSANIRAKGRTSVRDTFRAVVDERLFHKSTRFAPDDPSTSLRTTLFHLASRRTGELHTGDPGRLMLHKCPSCSMEGVEVFDKADPQYCPQCGGEVFASDCLRLWEEVNEFQSNQLALSRFMMLIEHLLPVHYCRYLLRVAPQLLSSTAFFIDGPLAVFRTGAWLHASILNYLAEVNERLVEIGLQPIIVIGLQKTGQVVDHAKLVSGFIEEDRLLLVDDEYRYKFILADRDPAGNGFGHETYYGQDFIYKTPTGRIFVLALPYPFKAKSAIDDFVMVKTEIHRYTQLARALALIRHFEYDLYENAVIPVALAHRYTAISLVPGGRVLDILTRRALDAKMPGNNS